MEKISIVTPLYNSEKFIHETIRSVVNQTFQNWELLIVDDCSTDSSVKVVSGFLEKDSRIKLFKNERNCGAAVCRNIGLSNASGRFIAFIDSDDTWLPKKLEKQLCFMMDHDYEISFTDYELVNENKLSLGVIVKSVTKINYKGYLKNTIIGMSTSMIDTSKTGVFEFVNLRTRQDTYLWISLLKRGLYAYGLNEVLVNYMVRNDSISADKVKAAKRVWYIYYNLENFGFLKSSYYFSLYAFNAIKKRL
jgi:teichuronic acid biosynthesis glycosyltransferase TuaG